MLPWPLLIEVRIEFGLKTFDKRVQCINKLLAGRAGNILEAGCAYLDVAHIMPRTGPDLGHLYNAPAASIFSPHADPPTNQGPGECKQQ